MELEVVVNPSLDHVYTNHVYMNSRDLCELKSNYIQVADYIYWVSAHDKIRSGELGLHSLQRDMCHINLTEKITVKSFDPRGIQPIDELILSLEPYDLMKKRINYPQFRAEFLHTFKNQILSPEQIIFTRLTKNIKCHVDKIIDLNGQSGPSLIHDDIILRLDSPYTNLMIENQPIQKQPIFKDNFNLQSLGIGGLEEEVQTIFRRAFASRRLSPKVAKELNIKHVRGMVLYGPPGCGKTLLARQIGQALNCPEPKIVTGPSLLNRYVGSSEEAVRDLFKEAIADIHEEQVHVIILDEFDSIGKNRGTSQDSTGVQRNVVNQFLSMIDGPKSLNNILVIVMSNNIDILDPALLRPGRLEVHIEIKLPTGKGRREILDIHTQSIQTHKYTDGSINLSELAQLTPNFTGAELEGIVKSALSYAISRQISIIEAGSLVSEKITASQGISETKNFKTEIRPIVTQSDLLRGMSEIIPMFGQISDQINHFLRVPFIFWSSDLKDLYLEALNHITNLKPGQILPLTITGDSYTGKTTLACYLAQQSQVTCVRMITPDKLLRCTNKVDYILSVFEQCVQAENSVLIFDNLERLIEFSSIGMRFNNSVLQAIMILLNQTISYPHRMVVILTSSNLDLLDQLDISSLIDHQYQIKNQIENTQILCPNYNSKTIMDGTVSDVFRFMKRTYI